MKSYQQFFAEMKRRKVFRVMAVYGVIGFGVIEAAGEIFPRVGIPDWAVTLVVWLVLLGFPIAVVLVWAFESSPEGVRRTEDATSEEIEEIIAQPAARRWSAGLLALAGVGLLFGGWWVGQRGAGAELNLTVPEARASDFETIAVLPFDNVGGQSDEDVLASGLQYDLQQNLGKLQALRVISPESVREYGESTKGDGQIADELGADYILRGSVLRAGERVRVNVQLINAVTTEPLWGDQFDQEVTPENLFDINSRIAVEIARQLATELSPADLAVLDEEPPSENLAALAAYNRAREPGGAFLAGLPHAERAVELDPDFLEAWALVARLRSRAAWIGGGDRDLALAAVQRAESLDSESPEAAAARAFHTYYVEQNFELASVQLRRAQTLAPSDADVAEAIGDLYRRLGEWEESLAAFRRAVEIDPRNPDLLVWYSTALEMVGRLAAADEVAERALQVAPSVPSVRGRKVETDFYRYGDIRRTRNLANELGLDSSVEEERRRLISLAIYARDLEEASRLVASWPSEEIPWLEMNRLLSAGEVAGLRGMDTEAIGASILQLDWETTAEGLRNLADFEGYYYMGEQDRAWPLLEEAERVARAAGEMVVVQIVRNERAAKRARSGQVEDALEDLEAMVDRPGFGLTLADLQHHPNWDPLRGNPRFDAILERRRAFEEQGARDAEADRPWLP